MKLTKVAMALALATGVATSAFATAPKSIQKGSEAEETARILDPNVANP